MGPGVARVGGVSWHYAVSDNEATDGWAVNLHGFFSGGGVHYRESTRLAADLGVKVVNPTFPGFAGSEAMPWDKVSFGGLAEGLRGLLDHLGVPPALVLGHSMGGAVAIQLAHDHPERVVGVICRDGVAVENWKQRTGILAKALSPVSPDLGSALEILLGFTVELPQLGFSRWRSLSVTAGPDIRSNMRAGSITLPFAAMLLGSDLTPITAEVGRRGDIPVMPVWGRFDLAIPVSTGREVARLLGEELIVVPGTHCWMLANPRTQVALLRTRAGRVFLDRVAARASILGAPFPLAA